MLDKFFKPPGETKNITPKIFALVLAIVLWLYVMNEQNPPIDSSFTIPLEVRNTATDYVVVDAPENVRVKVRGPRSVIAGVLIQDIKSYIDTKGLTEGRHSVKVNAAIPSSLELVEINPEKVQIRLDTTISRQMPVEVRWSGAPAKGTSIGKVVVASDQVTVEGPKNVVATVDNVLAAVDVSGKNTEFAADVALTPVNKEGKEVEGLVINPEKTRVTVQLVADIVKKLVDIKPVTQGELPVGLVVRSITTQPNKIEVKETTPGKRLERLEAIYTEPINLTEISQDTVKEVRLLLAEGVTALQETVIVTITIGPR